jgi:DNA polymerase III alpha subunit
MIRVPLSRAKGLSCATTERLLSQRAQGPFLSLANFYRRVQPQPAEIEIIIRAGGLDEFNQRRTEKFWEAQQLQQSVPSGKNLEFGFNAGVDPVSEFFYQNPALLKEPTRREQLEAQTELFGFAVSGHSLELFADVAWDSYCPVSRLGEHVGKRL